MQKSGPHRATRVVVRVLVKAREEAKVFSALRMTGMCVALRVCIWRTWTQSLRAGLATEALGENKRVASGRWRGKERPTLLQTASRVGPGRG